MTVKKPNRTNTQDANRNETQRKESAISYHAGR
jgi:hypothetical protein